MNQDQAFKKAHALWKAGMVIIGRNYNYPDKSYHVGVKDYQGVWLKRGVGSSFEEAFENIENYPDGKKPVTVNL